MNEVEFLLEKSKESLEAAELLYTQSHPDFAASRAYYVMFYLAQAVLLTKGLAYSSHSAVVAAFGKEFAKTGLLDAKYHRRLIDAQDIRSVGDYGIGTGVSVVEAKKLIDWAREFLDVAQDYLRR